MGCYASLVMASPATDHEHGRDRAFRAPGCPSPGYREPMWVWQSWRNASAKIARANSGGRGGGSGIGGLVIFNHPPAESGAEPG
jgi:hypothetical protein